MRPPALLQDRVETGGRNGFNRRMKTSAVSAYLDTVGVAAADASALAYIAALESVARVAPLVARATVQELADQRANIKLIASENYSSLSTQLAMASLMTDKYAEGIPQKRYYAGCDNVDAVEEFAAAQACKLFGADHAYVQPHSGADANLVAFWAILSARVEAPTIAEFGCKSAIGLSEEQWAELRRRVGNQRLLAMAFSSGGHLTHGYRMNVSAKMFDAFAYTVSPETKLLDYDRIEEQALELRPLILLAGYSAYPRLIDFERMRAIADKAGAVLMVDMAHFAGLVAGGAFTGTSNPVPYADVVTTTTHKTLRGPRGGLVLCKDEFAEHVDRGCPMLQGGPMPHVMSAKALCFTEALRPEFKSYAAQVVENARALAEGCMSRGLDVLSGGTDNHQVILDVTDQGVSGRQAEAALRLCRLTSNRNAVPFDRNSPLITSGLRMGTPAVTTLGMTAAEMDDIAAVIAGVLAGTEPAAGRDGKPSKIEFTIAGRAQAEATAAVDDLLGRFPVYPQLDLKFLERHFCTDADSAAAAG